MSDAPTATQILYIRDGSEYRIATPEEMLAALDHMLCRRFHRGSSLESPDAVRSYLKLKLADLQFEVFWMISVDARHRVLALDELFRGTIDGATVHPREVVREALEHNAAAVLFVHNHPSGVAEPSHADELITQRLKQALSLVDIRVLDHLIVGGPTVLSMAEKGLV